MRYLIYISKFQDSERDCIINLAYNNYSRIMSCLITHHHSQSQHESSMRVSWQGNHNLTTPEIVELCNVIMSLNMW